MADHNTHIIWLPSTKLHFIVSCLFLKWRLLHLVLGIRIRLYTQDFSYFHQTLVNTTCLASLLKVQSICNFMFINIISKAISACNHQVSLLHLHFPHHYIFVWKSSSVFMRSPNLTQHFNLILAKILNERRGRELNKLERCIERQDIWLDLEHRSVLAFAILSEDGEYWVPYVRHIHSFFY